MFYIEREYITMFFIRVIRADSKADRYLRIGGDSYFVILAQKILLFFFCHSSPEFEFD